TATSAARLATFCAVSDTNGSGARAPQREQVSDTATSAARLATFCAVSDTNGAAHAHLSPKRCLTPRAARRTSTRSSRCLTPFRGTRALRVPPRVLRLVAEHAARLVDREERVVLAEVAAVVDCRVDLCHQLG